MDKCSGTGQIRRFCALPFRRKLRAVRTIGQLWRNATAAGRTRPAYLVERARRLGGGLVGRGRAARSRSSRTACWRWACARATRSGSWPRRASSGRSSTTRWRASVRSGRRSTRTARRRTAATCSSTRTRSACWSRTRRSGRRSRTSPLAHVLTFADLDELRARGREFAAANPEALAEAEAQIGEEDIFTFIYTSGTTGPPKACMIRHRNYYEMATVHRRRPGVRLRRRRDAALPAAGPQLRAADAPARRAQGLHDRVLPGPAARRRGDAGGAADAAAERAAALREGAHGRARAVRAGARAATAAARLGARGRAAR